MLKRRHVELSPDEAPDHLLNDLLEAPIADARLRPVMLRSVKEQRRNALSAYLLRTWVDSALVIGERVLTVVVVAFFGWWLIDGYGRDWWHARQVAQTAVVAQAAATAIPTQVPTAQPHPELGASLPVVDERWSRPGVTLDYLAPARIYVAPLLPTPAPPQPAPPVDLRPTHLVIPAIGLDSQVVEVFVQDGVWQVADYAVGYHHGTGVVGRSNMVLAGHKGLRGAVFSRLEYLKPGDEVIVEAAGQRTTYRVRSTGTVWPSQIDVMFPTEQPQLTLLTCTNWDTQRFIVTADLIGTAPATTAVVGN